MKIDTHKLLDDVNVGLRVVVSMALEESDSRFYGVLEALSQAVWKTAQDIQKLKEGDIDPEELRKLLNAMQGRVLTVLEAAFKSPMQCEALKSLARQKMWRYFSREVEGVKS